MTTLLSDKHFTIILDEAVIKTVDNETQECVAINSGTSTGLICATNNLLRNERLRRIDT